MRLTTTTFVTLDGVMQGPGSPDEDRSGGFDLGGWLPPHFDETVGAYMDEVFGHASAFLLGRRTYDGFVSYWPHVTDPAEAGVVGAKLNELPKYVVTHRSEGMIPWDGAERVKGDLVAAVTELKSQPGEELQVHGSGTVAKRLMDAGLVDLHRLVVFPVVLGRGRRLFADGVPPTGLRLVDNRASGSGVLLVTYENAGVPAFGAVEGS